MQPVAGALQPRLQGVQLALQLLGRELNVGAQGQGAGRGQAVCGRAHGSASGLQKPLRRAAGRVQACTRALLGQASVRTSRPA